MSFENDKDARYAAQMDQVAADAQASGITTGLTTVLIRSSDPNSQPRPARKNIVTVTSTPFNNGDVLFCETWYRAEDGAHESRTQIMERWLAEAELDDYQALDGLVKVG